MRLTPMPEVMVGIGLCQRCQLPIKFGEAFMPRIPFVAGWRGFDHQYCPPRLVS